MTFRLSAIEPRALGEINVKAIEGQCRWIHGNVLFKRWWVCGNPVNETDFYCAFHDAKTRPEGGRFRACDHFRVQREKIIRLVKPEARP